MKDKDQTKEQLIRELKQLRHKVAELEKYESGHDRPERAGDKLNARLNAIIKAFDGFMYVCSQDYRVEFMNERLIERTGCDGTGDFCYKVLHERDSVCPWCVNEQVFRGETVRWEVKSPKDGRWYYVVDTPLYSQDSGVSKLALILDITDRKIAEENLLKRSEEKYRELVENAASIILRLDRAGNVTFFNEFAQRFFGYGEEEILGKNAVGTIVPEVESTGRDLRKMVEDLVLDPDLYVNNINENVRRNGDRVWVAWTFRPVVDDKSRVAEILCIGNDVTEQKAAEQSLRESEERFRKFAEEASFEGIIFEHEGKVLDVNGTLAKMSGYTRSELIGMDVLDLVAPESRPLAQTLMHSSYEEVYEFLAVKKDGATLPVEVHSRLVPYFGKMVRAAAVRDTTEKKRFTEALQAANRQLQDVIEFLPDATLVVDRQGKVMAWNRAMEKMTGIKKGDILGKGDYAYAVPFYGKPRPMLVDFVKKSSGEPVDLYDFAEWEGKLLVGEVFLPKTLRGKDAHIWGKASPLFDKDGNLIGAIETIRDITRLKQVESMLLKREADLKNKAHQLEDINTALKVVLRRREDDKKDLEESILANVKESILPFVEKLKKTHLDENQITYLAIVESQLDKIVSPFLRSLSSRFTNLTPMEIKVARLIKEGKMSKEVAEILGVSEQTILTHRNNLRAKLGLRNQKANLRSHLMSLT